MRDLGLINMNERIAIIGAGELGRQIAHLAAKNDYQIVGFFDDYCTETAVYDIPLLGKIKDVYTKKDKYDSVVIGIGYKHMDVRKNLCEELNEKEIRLATIIDKTAIIDPTVKVGAGSVIMANVVIDKDASIGDNVFIYISVTIAHDSIIGSHSFLAPRVAIAGFTTIGESTFLGINTTIIDNLILCPHLIVGGGAVVVNNIQQPGIYAGVPAKLLNEKK